MSLFAPTTAESRRKLIYGASACALVVFVGLGVFANNGWLPHTDSLTGKKTGWFGKELPKNDGSTWNPLAAPLPTPTPQLSKEYIYAGQRLLAVEDANANATPPADLAVWRPSSGVWYVLGGPGSQQVTREWGSSTAIPVPGDYDGDGKTDFTVYGVGTPSLWYILNSSNGQVVVHEWGWQGYDDKPLSADFDGDGKSDVAVYRNGTWYVKKSSDSQTLSITWGTSSDVPAPADYDGDGKADFAFWRDSDHLFCVYRSSDGQMQLATIGSAPSGVTPVPADYDGDGKADFAVFDPNMVNGYAWYILQSSNSTLAIYEWGEPGDKPVPNDYDGDGKCDRAIWRPSTGVWYIINSHDASTRTVEWGIPGDIPVPAYYRR